MRKLQYFRRALMSEFWCLRLVLLSAVARIRRRWRMLIDVLRGSLDGLGHVLLRLGRRIHACVCWVGEFLRDVRDMWRQMLEPWPVLRDRATQLRQRAALEDERRRLREEERLRVLRQAELAELRARREAEWQRMRQAEQQSAARRHLHTGDPFDAYWQRDQVSTYVDEGKAAHERSMNLLRENLTRVQLLDFTMRQSFEVIGGHTGKRYRIRSGRTQNIDELDAAGNHVCEWCFAPRGAPLLGDVMLAQKLALELFELDALAIANKYPPLPAYDADALMEHYSRVHPM